MRIQDLEIGTRGYGLSHSQIKDCKVRKSAVEANVKVCPIRKNYTPIIRTDRDTYIVDETYRGNWPSAKKRRGRIIQLFRKHSSNPKVIDPDLEARTKDEIMFEKLGVPLVKSDTKNKLAEGYINLEWTNKKYIIDGKTGKSILEVSNNKSKIFSLSDVLKKDERPNSSGKK
ncbi:MAG: hypothetical protein JSW73_04760 [Candidatus Woesearchaeota archaeon]|nr:MAG: hypothetical protein JSW73_04760 [Candidatus Woesearchaeota archaeon]